MRGGDRFSDARITRVDKEDQNDTEDCVEQGRDYEVHQSTNGDHSVHSGVQAGRT